MKMSDKLIELRKEKGWSQEDFAEKLDVSRQAISRWENGIALPDAQNILRISKLFRVTADYLLNDDYQREVEPPALETAAETVETAEATEATQATEDTTSVSPKKKFLYWYLIPAVCFVILTACMIIWIVKTANEPTNEPTEVHLHSGLSCVKENEVAPTCTKEGSYDEVYYCTACEAEVLRTTKIVAPLAHTLSNGVKENEVVPTCTKEGSYDEVYYCTVCEAEVLRTTQKVAKLAHTLSSSVKENEIAPSCTKEGSYDEVVYCKKCNDELLRTRRTRGIVEHRYQNGICAACNQYQPSEGLLYMSSGDGTCFVDIGDCTDENVVIPAYSPSGEKVVQIKARAFAGNRTIKSVRLPETVTQIGAGAFEYCTNLESINLPSNLDIIQNYTFNGCEKLKEITIPNRVYYIGMEAFADCIACESIVIPASVRKIGKNAFRNFSSCDGTVTFEVYDGWELYDDSDNCVGFVDFKNGAFTPVLYLTYLRTEYMWKRR